MAARISWRKAALIVTAAGVLPIAGVGVAKWATAANVRSGCPETGSAANPDAGTATVVLANGQSVTFCTGPNGPDLAKPARGHHTSRG